MQGQSEESERAERVPSKRWTYRGVGSDHEIVVRLRESTPASGDDDVGGGQSKKSEHSSSKEPSVGSASPERLLCALCKRIKSAKDFWWCRTCQKTLCSSCNLLQGHTEHRTAPWRPEELVRSLVDTVEARCTARSVRAAEEEAAIKEYMREIENYFLTKLKTQLEERNDDDRGLMKAVSASTGVTFTDRKQWAAAWPPAPVSPNGSTNLAQFSSLLTDDSLARLVKEIRDRLLTSTDGLSVTKWPRMLGSTTPASSPTASPMVNGRGQSEDGGTEDEEEMQRLVNVTQHFYSFAAVLPSVEPLEFAQLLEQQSEFSPHVRSRSHSTFSKSRGITPTIERVNSRMQSPASRGLNGPSALAANITIEADAVTKKQLLPSDQSHLSPPVSGSRSDFVRNDYRRKTIPTSTVASTSRTETSASTHIVQAVISDDGSRATPSSSAREPRTEPQQRRELQKSDSTSSDTRRRFSLPNRKKSNTKEETPPLADTSAESNMDDLPRRQRQMSTPNGGLDNGSNPVSVTAFNFGEDYLTRPIDVRPLEHDILAVSDSCGGVYITDAKGGKVIHQIWLDGNSASSLCYVPFFPDQPRRPPILLVSVLRKNDRSVRFYDANKFTLLDEIPCPIQPEIDLGRSRWLSTDDRGAIFMISGDGKISALWKYHSSSPKLWALLKQAPNTRYQYLDVVHHVANASSVTLLTCNGSQGSVLMITVSRAGKILAEQDFSESYGLGRYIRSPASAVVDYRGNMLILDYFNGKLWILKAPKGNRQGGDRRLKLLSEFGGQQAMGISVTPTYWQSDRFIEGEQWCYVACFNKQWVHAVKYLSD